MSLYRYRKIENYENRHRDYITIEDDVQPGGSQPNIWSTSKSGYSLLYRLANSSYLANLVIPGIFIAIGLYFIGQYFYPHIQSSIEQSNGQVAQGTTALTTADYIDRSTYISNPAGLDVVTAEAFEQDVLQNDAKSHNYRGTFYISVPSLGINRLPVQANVDSTTEVVYNEVLKNSLAHFDRTGLPISDVRNNIVIYGHSASPNYNPQPSDPEVAFSFLPDLKVGDEIILEIEGEEYRFRMFQSKIVEPTDLSIVTGSPNQRTLTLFTCYPAGNNANRYVAVARPVGNF